MKKSIMFVLGLAMLLAMSGMMEAGAATSGYVGGINASGEASSSTIVPGSIAPEAIEYVEGLNDDETVDDVSSYAADWFGIEYTPTISYNLKKVELIAGEGTGEYIIQLRSDSAGMPSDTILREASFTQVDTVSWQGAEFAESYPLTAGTTYWIVFKPVAGSQASVAQSGTLITYVWDYSDDGWDGKLTEPWMVKFYKEVVEFQYHFRLAPGINVVHLNANPGGWLNGYMTGGPADWNPVLGKYEAGRFYMAIDIIPDATPGYYEMLFLVGTVATRTGQLIQTVDGMSYDGPWDVTLEPVAAQSEELEGPDITEVSGSQVTPEAWYTFQVNPYPDIVHLNTNPGGWLNGYDEYYEPDAPVLGFAERGRFYFGIDGIDTPYTLAFIAGKVSTRDGDMIRTVNGTTFDGPYSIWLTPV